MTLRGYIASITFLIALGFLSLGLGSVAIHPCALFDAYLSGPMSSNVDAQIVWSIRLPRLLLALAAGVVMARAGLLLQIITGNPLADPYLFGLSSGASAGAIATIVFFGDRFGLITTFLGASAGALVATAMLMFLIISQPRDRNALSKGRLILGGLAISFLFTTCADLLVYAGDRNTAQAILFWTVGSLSAADWRTLPFAAASIVILDLFVARKALQIESLRAGEDTSRSLGVQTSRLRVEAVLVSALACGLIVAICGPIPFVGLIVPHIVRGTGRSSIVTMMPLTGVAGASLMVLSDVIGRVLLPHQEVPAGIIVSAAGSLFLGWLVLRGRI